MPVINPIFTKDFPDLGRALLDTDIIVVAVPGDQITYKTTVAALKTSLAVVVTGVSDSSGEYDASGDGIHSNPQVTIYDVNGETSPATYDKTTQTIKFLNPSEAFTAVFS